MKRLRDEGRKFSPVVKKEASQVHWHANEVPQDDGESCSDTEAMPANEEAGKGNDVTGTLLAPAASQDEDRGMKRSRSAQTSGVKVAQISAKNASKKLKKMRTQK